MFSVTALAGIAIWLVYSEAPRWHPGGSLIVPHDPLPPIDSQVMSLSADVGIACIGDSNTKGASGSLTLGHSAPPEPFCSILGKALRVPYSVHAIGGSTASDGLKHKIPGNGSGLIILSFGTNDAAPRGWLSSRKPTKIADYRKSLEALVAAHSRPGTRVLVLAPFPSGSRAMERRIAPYRQAARQAAMASGASFLDPVSAFPQDRPMLATDGLHLSAEAHRLLAAWLAKHIVVTSHRAAPN